MPDTSPTSPDFDELGPPAGSPDALALWRDVLQRLASMSPREREHLDLELVAARGDVWAAQLDEESAQRDG